MCVMELPGYLLNFSIVQLGYEGLQLNDTCSISVLWLVLLVSILFI